MEPWRRPGRSERRTFHELADQVFVPQSAPAPLCLETTRTNWEPHWEPWEHSEPLDSTAGRVRWALERLSSLLVRCYSEPNETVQAMVSVTRALMFSFCSTHRSQCQRFPAGHASAAAQCPSLLTVRRLATFQKPAVRSQEEGGGECFLAPTHLTKIKTL